jgi:hypothetical protein
LYSFAVQIRVECTQLEWNTRNEEEEEEEAEEEVVEEQEKEIMGNLCLYT